MISEYLLTLLVILIAFTLLFGLAQYLKNNSVIDTFWGISFIIAAITALVISLDFSSPQIVVTILVFIWGSRLSTRIYLRNKGKAEDWRYAAWRIKWGDNVLFRSYTDVFLVQAIFCFLVSIPVIYINLNNLRIAYPVILIIGILLWIFGFLFETIGDNQLDEFKKSKPKKESVLNTGLWQYTRHPNYFGEATQWWAIGIIVLSTGFSAWWTLIGPITITYLLLKVSGIPMLEKKMSKNPKYKSYMAKTNKFLPGPVKN